MTPHDTRPPRSVRTQRVLLWIYAVMFLGNALWAMGEVGGGARGLGYALPYFFLGFLSGLLALKTVSRARWVRVTTIALHGVLILLQLSRTLAGDVFGLIGLLIAVFGLVLALRSSARDYFSVAPIKV